MQSEFILSKLYCELKSLFESANISSFDFDAIQIIKHCVGFDRHDIIVNPKIPVDVEAYAQMKSMADRRVRGEPLQYILGIGPFMDYDLKVGPGVLIPRDDTQVLVREAFSFLDNQYQGKTKLKILDLCSGSGAIAIAIANRYKRAKVIALEFSDLAIRYCRENMKRYAADNLDLVQYDILKGPDSVGIFSDVDVIVSNPPYIPTAGIKTLQREVQHEPLLALDGGDDGLDFYRALAKQWMNIIVPAGKMILEIGIGQAKSVSDLFRAEGYSQISVTPDLSGIDRVVAVER